MKKYTLLFLILFLGISEYSTAQSYKSPKEYMKEAKDADVKGDFRKSADISLQGLKQHPYYIDLKQQLGKSYMNLKMIDSARYYLKKVADQDLDNVAVRHYLVNLEFSTKRYSSAICYVNELLEKTPYWRGLWFKKIEIYKAMGNLEEVKRATIRLRQIFPNDTIVYSYYKGVMYQEGQKKLKKGNLIAAKKSYLTILKDTPSDKETSLKLIQLEINDGRFESALEYTDRTLVFHPKDIELIKKKISILVALFKYDTALNYLKSKQKVLQNDYYKKTTKFLTYEAATFYENTDPYILHQKSYNLNRNYESFNFLLNKSFERGHYEETLRLINDGLRRNPSSKKLLVRQMAVYKNQKNTSKYIKSVRNLFKQYPNDYDIRQEYVQVLLKEAQEYIANKQYQQAIYNFNDLLNFIEFNTVAKNGLFTAYALKNSFFLALNQIDLLIKENPDNPIYRIKKAELLKNHKNYEEALTIAQNLQKEYPDDIKYKQQYLDYLTTYITRLNAIEEYQKAQLYIDKYLDIDKKNPQIYFYGINTAFATENYEKMLQYATSGLEIFPKDIPLRLKQINAYSLLGDYKTSEKLLEDLSKKHPVNNTIKNTLIDERFKLAVLLEKENPEKAVLYYRSILKLNPKHIDSYKRLVNILISEKEYVQAMLVIDDGLKKTKKEEAFFFYKKGTIYEAQGDFKNAYYYQKKSQKKKEIDLTDHLDYLSFFKLKNSIGVDYLSITLNENNFRSAAATLFYIRNEEKNTYGTYITYVPRSIGVGMQLNLQWSHKFSKKLYTTIDGSIASNFFPKLRITGSAFNYFKNDWEGQIGIGYIEFQNNTNVINPIFGVSKILDDFWLNAKLNLFLDKGDVYNNILLQGRYTTNEKGDLFFAMGAIGNVAQDDTFNYQIANFTTYTNSVVGIGYKWAYKYKYYLSVAGNLYNFKVSETKYIEQYHLYFSIQTKF